MFKQELERTISESTVEVHVKRILSKLGFRSRSQVAAWTLISTSKGLVLTAREGSQRVTDRKNRMSTLTVPGARVAEDPRAIDVAAVARVWTDRYDSQRGEPW